MIIRNPMNNLLFYMTLIISMNSHMIFDFNKNSDIQSWIIVDDIVMGGRSSGNFSLSPDGFGVFEGHISLDNNGGFSSVRYQFERINVKERDKIIIRIMGDGKKYQLRVKDDAGKYYSYITSFSTSGEWQEIEILLKELSPSFRGRKLDQPNFSHDYIEEIAFLIGNNKTEEFKLLIDKIYLN